MYARVVTTITTMIDLDAMTPDHSVSIEPEDGVPADLAYAAALGGCKATIASIAKSRPYLADDFDTTTGASQ
jgi:hypothetical protein